MALLTPGIFRSSPETLGLLFEPVRRMCLPESPENAGFIGLPEIRRYLAWRKTKNSRS